MFLILGDHKFYKKNTQQMCMETPFIDAPAHNVGCKYLLINNWLINYKLIYNHQFIFNFPKNFLHILQIHS